MKTAIKIGCVVLGTLALGATTVYLVHKRRKRVIKLKSEAVVEPELEPEPQPKRTSMDSKEFVARLRERKKNK